MSGTLQKKIYFASDFHLGAPDDASSLVREKKLVAWMDSIKPDCGELFLVGDLFDAWYEYKRVVPRGFTRFLGKISEFTDAGIPVHVFLGNHDMWMFGYLEKECGVKLYPDECIREWNGKKFFIHHGDGIGPGDGWYKFMRAGFRNKFLQWCYSRLHPNFAVRLAQKVSMRGFDKKEQELTWHGDEKELQMLFCKDTLKKTHYDYFVFGHRHIPFDKECGPNSRVINLGDWIVSFTYGVFDGEKMELKSWK